MSTKPNLPLVGYLLDVLKVDEGELLKFLEDQQKRIKKLRDAVDALKAAPAKAAEAKAKAEHEYLMFSDPLYKNSPEGKANEAKYMAGF